MKNNKKFNQTFQIHKLYYQSCKNIHEKIKYNSG